MTQVRHVKREHEKTPEELEQENKMLRLDLSRAHNKTERLEDKLLDIEITKPGTLPVDEKAMGQKAQEAVSHLLSVAVIPEGQNGDRRSYKVVAACINEEMTPDKIIKAANGLKTALTSRSGRTLSGILAYQETRLADANNPFADPVGIQDQSKLIKAILTE